MSFYVSAVRIRDDGGEISSQKREMYLSRVTNLWPKPIILRTGKGMTFNRFYGTIFHFTFSLNNTFTTVSIIMT